jgi:hypothetical protein
MLGLGISGLVRLSVFLVLRVVAGGIVGDSCHVAYI